MKVTLKASNFGWRGKENLGLNPINFSVKEGEIFGLLGSAATKNAEVIKILTGRMSPTSGSLTILRTSNIGSIREQIGSTLDILGFIDEYSIEKNLKLLCMYKDIRPIEAAKMLRLFGLWNHKQKKMSQCNRAQRKRVAIICALIGNPKILLLDRPLEHLSKGSAIIVVKLLHKAAANGQTVFITDELSTPLTKICTQILELERLPTTKQIRKLNKAFRIKKKAS